MTEVEERQRERDAVRRKLESEKRRRQALRASMLRSPAERQAEVEACALMPGLPATDEGLAADENAHDHEGMPLRDALAWEMAQASVFLRRPLPVDATSLAVAVLTSHDYTHGLDVEALPLHAVSFGRLWGHLYAVGLALDPMLAASVARRMMRLLLNRDRRETTKLTSAATMPQAEVSLAAVPVPDDRFATTELPEEPVDATPARVEAAAVEDTTHGRRVTGYVRLRESVEFRGSPAMAEGRVVELLQPTEGEQENLKQSSDNHRTQVVVWWHGRSRFVPANLVERVGSDAWWEQNEEEDPDEH